MSHVTFDEMSGGQSGHQRELPRQDGGADDTCQLAGVLTRLLGARNAEHLQRFLSDVKAEGKTKLFLWFSASKGRHTCRQACCGGRMVPPPTVPSSMEGMVQLMYRSFPSGPAGSIRVMQLLLPTDWAGSCGSEACLMLS